MNPILRPCCKHARKRSTAVAEWLVPGLLLVLMPKCPACLAAYIALATGIGLSLPVASFVRTTLIVMGVATLAFLIIRQIGVRLGKKSTG